MFYVLGVSKPRTRAAELSRAPRGRWLFGVLPLHAARCWMQPDAVVAQRYHRLRLPNMVAMGTRMSKDVELVKKDVKKR